MPLIDTLIEKDILPDSVIRWGIRRLLKQRLADERPESAAARIRSLSVAPLVAEAIKRVHTGESISTLFA